MVSGKLVQRTNEWLNPVEYFYTYSWINGLCFGYFKFFLSSLHSIKNYVNPITHPSVCVLTFSPYGNKGNTVLYTLVARLVMTTHETTRLNIFVYPFDYYCLESNVSINRYFDSSNNRTSIRFDYHNNRNRNRNFD